MSKDLVWHRWTTGNFTILALEKKQGQYLAKNLERVKGWIMKRWGFPNIDFSAECRVLAVPNEKLMRKLFRIDRSMVEVRKDKDTGKIDLTVVWLLLDGSPSETIPPPLTKICLAELEQKYDLSMGLWMKYGLSALDQTIPDIRQDILTVGDLIKKDDKIYLSKELFTTEDLNKCENKDLFIKECEILCLFLRREFGQKKLHQFMKYKNPLKALDQLYGFSSYEQFDESMLRYMKDLGAGVENNSTPDTYLTITPAKKR
jgi:hypothetical protein